MEAGWGFYGLWKEEKFQEKYETTSASTFAQFLHF